MEDIVGVVLVWTAATLAGELVVAAIRGPLAAVKDSAERTDQN